MPSPQRIHTIHQKSPSYVAIANSSNMIQHKVVLLTDVIHSWEELPKAYYSLKYIKGRKESTTNSQQIGIPAHTLAPFLDQRAP